VLNIFILGSLNVLFFLKPILQTNKLFAEIQFYFRIKFLFISTRHTNIINVVVANTIFSMLYVLMYKFT
jgi:hypothetical protein